MPEQPTEDQKKAQQKQAKEQEQAQKQASQKASQVAESETDEQAEAERGLKAANVSTEEFDGNVAPEDKIVETNNGASMTQAELDENLAVARQAAREGTVSEDEGQSSVVERSAGKSDLPQK